MTNAMTEERDEQSCLENHFVYIVQCADGSLYTGYARNVERRVATHNAGKGSKYTRSHRPVTLLAAWSFEKKGEALRAELAIKRLSRAQKWRLLGNAVPMPGSRKVISWIRRSTDEDNTALL